jgi:hypothetical protein
MKSYHIFVIFSFSLLVGCNTPTPSSELIVPHFSSAPYENLSCSELAVKREKMEKSVQELSAMQDNGNYMMHADIPFMGTGDTMGTIELVKLRARVDAIERAYKSKKCSF